MFRTEKQVSELCHSCPFAKAANLLGDSVTLFILKELHSSEKSFSLIEESLGSVSSRTISEKLKLLEEVGVIARREETGKPTRVFYTLTKKAKSFAKVESSLLAFGNEFFLAS
jgi:DNA-binding HxlR family transcriptional regulator